MTGLKKRKIERCDLGIEREDLKHFNQSVGVKLNRNVKMTCKAVSCQI